MDTFAGFENNPVTLHKYAYGNLDPVNNVDPSGRFSIAQAMGADPVLGGGVMLTTVTDVVGFFVFLGLASLVLL